MKVFLFVFAFVSISAVNTTAQTAGSAPGYGTQDPLMVNISIELAKISRSVATLSDRLLEFVSRVDRAPGTTVSEKQAKLVTGLQLLASAEQILAARQRFQIELVEKQGTTRTRLAQVERDLIPQNIDRSVQFEGTTRTEELRENRRGALAAEKVSLQALLTQINSSLADVNESVREAQSLVLRLRKQYLPELEREMFDR